MTKSRTFLSAIFIVLAVACGGKTIVVQPDPPPLTVKYLRQSK